MGKLSDALKKSMFERERQRESQKARAAQTPQSPSAGNEVPAPKEQFFAEEKKAVSVPPVIEDRATKIKKQLLALKERFGDYAKSAVYVAKAKDDSGVDPRVVAYYNYQAPIADQYRIIRTNLKSYFKNSSSFSKITTSSAATRIIVVSSALHGEGKSITAANLAIVLAHDLESRVLLLDGDLRKGSIGKLFNISPERGLSDVLTDTIDYHQVIVPTSVSNLFLMPAGRTPLKPLELLSSRRMKLFIEQLKSDSFTYVIIDTPPLSLFSDAGVIAADTDGIVFVVQAYKTPAQIIKRAKELAEHSHAKIIGFVLTHTDYHIPDVYGYYQYYKYYSKEKHQ